jgi:pimeloyl-ACP methyl ester carboxylesterase
MPCPFLLAWGRDAGQTPLKEADAVRALRPNDPFVVLPGGDLPHEESAELFVAALERFIDASARPTT